MEVIKKFNDLARQFIKSKIAEELTITNKIEKKLFKKQYNFLGCKYKLPHYYELLEYDEINTAFSPEELDDVTRYLISKIHGLYKHAQSEKTLLCNIAIITSIRLKRFTIGITKNTLEANTQWTKRLITELKKEFPNTPLKELILVCSSKINTMGNKATHCKNVDAVIAKLAQHNTFRVLFVCSHDTRIEEILTLLNAYSGLSMEKQLPIHIQWDEAHNVKEGIPSKRPLIENILMFPIVEKLTPCTATASPINDETNPLWQKKNLEKNAINYTNMSKIKSTSPEYSSLIKAIRINFEDIKAHPSYSKYNILEFDLADFKKVDGKNYAKDRKELEKKYRDEGDDEETIKAKIEEYIRGDINLRRQLECYGFMKGEICQYEMGMNILDNFYEVPGTTNKLYKSNEQSFSIITTPKRNVFTYSLAKYAIKKPYKPIVIGLYKGKINIMYNDHENKMIEIEYGVFSEKNSEKEFNEKIEACLKYLVNVKKVNINVPFIFMGNYIPTGESITFVHYNYGTIRSVVLFPNVESTPDSEYQVFCRANYTTKKFIERDPNFIPPEKFIFSYKQQIDNALLVEKCNDDRIDELVANQTENPTVFAPLIHHRPVDFKTKWENMATPIKIQIEDMEDESIIALFEILKKEKRMEADRKKIMDILKDGLRTKLVSIIDKTGKFDIDRYTLKVVKTYRKKSEVEIQEERDDMGEKYNPQQHVEGYRFREYEANHNQGQPYTSYQKNIDQWECQLYACNDRYVCGDFVNPKQRMWMSYRH